MQQHIEKIRAIQAQQAGRADPASLHASFHQLAEAVADALADVERARVDLAEVMGYLPRPVHHLAGNVPRLGD